MAMPQTAEYATCVECGQECSEILDHSGKPLCDEHDHKLEWRDCDKDGHEEGCFVASCERGDCDWESYDCEEVAK